MDLFIQIGAIKMKLEQYELLKISGGISSAWITSLVRLFNSVIDFGRMVGSSIRRGISRNFC